MRTTTAPADYTPAIEGVKFGEVYAEVREGLGKADFLAAIGAAADGHRSATWWLGDLLAYGERVWNNYAEMAEATGYAVGTLRNMASVSRRVPRERRVPGLHWRTHRAVMALEPDDQTEWLRLALAKGMTSDELARAIREAGSGADGFEDPVGGACVCPKCGGTGTVNS